jgi:hypothetical protein
MQHFNSTFRKRNLQVISPSQFQINEAWIAFKLNDAPISTQEDGDFNVIALMDVASCYILGTEFVPTDSAELSQLESRRLLKSGESHKNQLPKKLFISNDLTANILTVEAESLGITVDHVPESELSIFLGEARGGFQEHVGGDRVQ